MRARGWAAGALVALGVVTALAFGSRRSETAEPLVRRESRARTLDDDVRIDLYTTDGLRRIDPQQTVSPTTSFTASYRNRHTTAAYAMIFGLDAAGEVHWLAPPPGRAHEEPAAVALLETARDTPFAASVVFDHPAPGPMRIVALVTEQAWPVSAIEKLTREERLAGDWARRFGADVRQWPLEVAASR